MPGRAAGGDEAAGEAGMPVSGRPWLLDEALPVVSRASTPEVFDGVARGGGLDLQYIVVDELDDGVAALVVEPWPVVDQSGRLRFPAPEDRVSAAVAAAELQELLLERLPVLPAPPPASDELVTRELRVGDVFGARVSRHVLVERPQDVAAWLHRPVIDVSGFAREAAKLQYFAALGPVLGEQELSEIVAEFFADADGGQGESSTPPAPA